MKLCKLLLAALGASVLLGALVSSASARNLEISNQRIRSTWSSVRFVGGFGEPDCHVTLEGSLHSRTMAKVIGSLIGFITSAILSNCVNGTATILRETLPWHVRYSGFQGALPNITSLIVHVIGAGFRIRETFGITCLALTSAAEPGTGTFHRSTASRVLTEAGIGGEIETTCGIRGRLQSVSGTVSLQGTASTRITVNLI